MGSSCKIGGTASDADEATKLDVEFRLDIKDDGGGLAPVGLEGRLARRSLRYSPGKTMLTIYQIAGTDVMRR